MASSKSLILLTVLLLVGVQSACRDGKSFRCIRSLSFVIQLHVYLFCFFIFFGVVLFFLYCIFRKTASEIVTMAMSYNCRLTPNV